MSRPVKKENGKGNVEWTRQQLIHAAAKEFARLGYEGASLKNIREAVDVKNATIHYHFGSKQGLYDAVIKNLEEHLIIFIAELDKYHDKLAMERLCLFAEEFKEWTENAQDFTSIIIQEMLSKQLRSADSTFYQTMGICFERIIQFIKGDDGEKVWRNVDWKIYIINFLFGILIGQGLSVAVPLTYSMNEDLFKNKQLDDFILTQFLSLAKDSKQAITFLQQHRPSCFDAN